jgi:ribosomal protein bL25 (Ctc-form)
MDIALEERESGKNSKRLNREGFISAVVYDKSGNSFSVKVDKRVFEAHLRQIEPGSLATVRFKCSFRGETFTAFIKDISYHKTTYAIQHIDFMRVKETDRICIYVPVVLKAADQCAGIAQGGQLKKVKRSVKISSLVNEIPRNFEINVKDIKLGDQIRVSDVVLTPSMKLKIHEKQVLVSVTKK